MCWGWQPKPVPPGGSWQPACTMPLPNFPGGAATWWRTMYWWSLPGWRSAPGCSTTCLPGWWGCTARWRCWRSASAPAATARWGRRRRSSRGCMPTGCMTWRWIPRASRRRSAPGRSLNGCRQASRPAPSACCGSGPPGGCEGGKDFYE